MLTKLEVRNSAAALLTLPFLDISGGYVLKSVDGLDPVKATIVTSSYATRDGVEYETAHRDIRNLIVHLGLEPDYAATTVPALRNALNKWFMTKRQVELRFYEDSGLITSVMGRVESNVAPRFTSDPGSDISIICPNPDFLGMTNELISGNTVADGTESTINYIGTVETGFLFTLNVNRTISGFSIYLRGEDNIQYELDFAASLIAGDVVQISTTPGNKFAILTRAGVTTSLLYGVSPSSPFVVLEPGVNKIRVLVSGAAIPYTIGYTDHYGSL